MTEQEIVEVKMRCLDLALRAAILPQREANKKPPQNVDELVDAAKKLDKYVLPASPVTP